MERRWSRRAVIKEIISSLPLAGAGALLAACSSGQATPTTAALPSTPASTPGTVPRTPASSEAIITTPQVTAGATPTVLSTRKLKMRVALATEEAGNFIVVEKGFFREAGFDVELVTTQGTPGEVIPLIAVGQLDLFSGAIQAALVNARLQGVEVTIVAGEGALRRGNVFHAYVVTKQLYEQGVHSIRDLRGRTLAMPSDAGIDLLELKMILERDGLTLDDIKMQLIRIPDMPVALQNGAVDAAELVEPYATIAIKQLEAGVPVLAGDAIVDIVGDNFPISVIVVGPPMMKDRPHLEAFLVGYLKGAQYYLRALKDSDARQEVVEILKNHTPLKDDALYAQMTWPGVSEDGTFDLTKLQEAQELWKARGKIQETLPVDQLADFSYVQNA